MSLHNFPHKEAIINTALAGDNVIISGIPGNTIRVFMLFFVCDDAVNVIIKDGAGTNLTGAMVMQKSGSVTLDLNESQVQWFTMSPGNDFVINLSGAVGIRGRAYYTISITEDEP